MSFHCTLGIEVENAWIKCVGIAAGGPRARAFPLPFTAATDRSGEVASGFISALTDFERDTGISPEHCHVAVAASTHFAYPTFREAHRHLVAILERHLPHAWLAAADGLHKLKEARAAEDPLPWVLARTVGIKAIARAHSSAALAVDCGSSSTEVVSLSQASSVSPAEDSIRRLTDGRLSWIGAIETPIDFVARQAGGWPLVPRMAKMRAIMALCRTDLAPDAVKAARREIAQAVGLDAEFLSNAVSEIASDVLAAARGELTKAFRQVLGPGSPPMEAAVLGIGAELLVRPALADCGIERIVDVEEAAGVPPNFGAAYGLALEASLAVVK